MAIQQMNSRYEFPHQKQKESLLLRDHIAIPMSPLMKTTTGYWKTGALVGQTALSSSSTVKALADLILKKSDDHLGPMRWRNKLMENLGFHCWSIVAVW
ncbi:hypothetical protein CEXT_755741 [Caerostris extrusa]|uniref:Uncharacterized protein n=1 Tax=Caerostris extrusa TaxID=172846 RepID=A0AAV4TIW6_CAEEX|nr:hypothetical protein CEXT_755741 [Caerostris extrusa]